MDIFFFISIGILAWVLFNLLIFARRPSPYAQADLPNDFDALDAWQKLDKMKEVWAAQTPEVLMEQRCHYYELLSKAFYPEDRRFFLEVIGILDRLRWEKMKEAKG